MSNKKAIKAQGKRINLLRDQKKQAEELLKNRQVINDLEYEIDKSEKERERLLRSPIDEHSSSINSAKIEVKDNATKEINKLANKVTGKKENLGEKYRCELDGSGEEEVIEITPDNIDKHPLTISGFAIAPTEEAIRRAAHISPAAFDDIKAEDYDGSASRQNKDEIVGSYYGNPVTREFIEENPDALSSTAFYAARAGAILAKHKTDKAQDFFIGYSIAAKEGLI